MAIQTVFNAPQDSIAPSLHAQSVFLFFKIESAPLIRPPLCAPISVAYGQNLDGIQLHESWIGAFDFIELENMEASNLRIACQLQARHYNVHVSLKSEGKDAWLQSKPSDCTYELQVLVFDHHFSELTTTVSQHLGSWQLNDRIASISLEGVNCDLDFRSLQSLRRLHVNSRFDWSGALQFAGCIERLSLDIPASCSIFQQPIHARRIALFFKRGCTEFTADHHFPSTRSISIMNCPVFRVNLDTLPELEELRFCTRDLHRSMQTSLTMTSTAPRCLHSLDVRCDSVHISGEITANSVICELNLLGQLMRVATHKLHCRNSEYDVIDAHCLLDLSLNVQLGMDPDAMDGIRDLSVLRFCSTRLASSELKYLIRPAVHLCDNELLSLILQRLPPSELFDRTMLELLAKAPLDQIRFLRSQQFQHNFHVPWHHMLFSAGAAGGNSQLFQMFDAVLTPETINLLHEFQGRQGSETLLHVFCNRKDDDIACELLNRGADPRIPDSQGRSVLEVCSSQRCLQIIGKALTRY